MRALQSRPACRAGSCAFPGSHLILIKERGGEVGTIPSCPFRTAAGGWPLRIGQEPRGPPRGASFLQTGRRLTPPARRSEVRLKVPAGIRIAAADPCGPSVTRPSDSSIGGPFPSRLVEVAQE